MEPETLAYDGDAAAWEQFQVPAAPLPPVPVFFGSPAVLNSQPSSPPLIAPTLHYSPPSSPIAREQLFLARAEPAVGCETQVVEATLHYSPSHSPIATSVGIGFAEPVVACETQAVEPTLHYSPPSSPIMASGGISSTASAARPAPACDTLAVEPTLHYTPPSSPVASKPCVARAGDVVSGGIAAMACETQVIAVANAFDTQPFVGISFGAPEAAVHGQLPPTLAYDLDAVIPPTLAYDMDASVPPTLAYNEAMAPTLAYGEDALRLNVLQSTSPPKASESAIPGSNGNAQERAAVLTSPHLNRAASEAASRAVEDTSIFAVPDSPHRKCDSPVTASASNVPVARVPKRTARASVATPDASAPKRRRLRGKQLPPVAYASIAAPSATEASSSRSVLTDKLRPETPATGLGAVLVRGDGWGGGSGEYLATVTETDAFSLTILRQYEDGRVEETHVLREHCDVVSEPCRTSDALRPRHSR